MSSSLGKKSLLVIVHPGSACGSADMNLGVEAAEQCRMEMQSLVEGWEGAVAVIDGELSDELSGGERSWSEWGRAINEALERARQQKLLAVRMMGDDSHEYNQQAATKDLVRQHRLDPQSTAITLTGAWVDDSGGGCVHAVREVLDELGFNPVVSDAMNLDFELEDGLDVDEEMSPWSKRF